MLTNLLATGAAFGVAKWIFQDGALHSLLGFQPQGFLDAWGPVFFFAMIFAISMDYTVFLLSSAKEHWDRTHDPQEAMVGGLAHSGRVIFAAGAVMVAVFFTFALSGPLPPKEMGIILGVAVLLDAALVRLLLLPVLLRLMGRWAWYLPRWAHRAAPRRHLRPRMRDKQMTMSAKLELWQTEWCPASRRVRQRLTELGLSFTAHQVPVEHDARTDSSAPGAKTIPVLVAGRDTVCGEEAILAYLDERFHEPPQAAAQREKAAKAKRKELERACPELAAATH